MAQISRYPAKVMNIRAVSVTVKITMARRGIIPSMRHAQMPGEVIFMRRLTVL